MAKGYVKCHKCDEYHEVQESWQQATRKEPARYLGLVFHCPNSGGYCGMTYPATIEQVQHESDVLVERIG